MSPIPPRDARWKVAFPKVKLPFRFGPLSETTPSFTIHDLQRKGVYAPYDPAGLFVTEPDEKKDKALQDGAAHVKKVRKEPGGLAEVIALIEWDDPGGRKEGLPQFWSAAVATYHSNS